MGKSEEGTIMPDNLPINSSTLETPTTITSTHPGTDALQGIDLYGLLRPSAGSAANLTPPIKGLMQVDEPSGKQGSGSRPKPDDGGGGGYPFTSTSPLPHPTTFASTSQALTTPTYTPSNPPLPIDHRLTEPIDAFYKLQFLDPIDPPAESSSSGTGAVRDGFSYYMQTLDVTIGRRVTKRANRDKRKEQVDEKQRIQSVAPGVGGPSSVGPDGEALSTAAVKQENEHVGATPKDEHLPTSMTDYILTDLESQQIDDLVRLGLADASSFSMDHEQGDITMADPVEIEVKLEAEPVLDEAVRDQVTPLDSSTVKQEPKEEDEASILAPPEGSPAVVPRTPEPNLEQKNEVEGEAEAQEEEQVDVDLGALKSVSRLHARIGYSYTLAQFYLEVLGRNGAWVDDVFTLRGTRVALGPYTKIQISSRTFYFILPPSSVATYPIPPGSIGPFGLPGSTTSASPSISHSMPFRPIASQPQPQTPNKEREQDLHNLFSMPAAFNAFAMDAGPSGQHGSSGAGKKGLMQQWEAERRGLFGMERDGKRGWKLGRTRRRRLEAIEAEPDAHVRAVLLAAEEQRMARRRKGRRHRREFEDGGEDIRQDEERRIARAMGSEFGDGDDDERYSSSWSSSARSWSHCSSCSGSYDDDDWSSFDEDEEEAMRREMEEDSDLSEESDESEEDSSEEEALAAKMDVDEIPLKEPSDSGSEIIAASDYEPEKPVPVVSVEPAIQAQPIVPALVAKPAEKPVVKPVPAPKPTPIAIAPAIAPPQPVLAPKPVPIAPQVPAKAIPPPGPAPVPTAASVPIAVKIAPATGPAAPVTIAPAPSPAPGGTPSVSVPVIASAPVPAPSAPPPKKKASGTSKASKKANAVPVFFGPLTEPDMIAKEAAVAAAKEATKIARRAADAERKRVAAAAKRERDRLAAAAAKAAAGESIPETPPLGVTATPAAKPAKKSKPDDSSTARLVPPPVTIGIKPPLSATPVAPSTAAPPRPPLHAVTSSPGHPAAPGAGLPPATVSPRPMPLAAPPTTGTPLVPALATPLAPAQAATLQAQPTRPPGPPAGASPRPAANLVPVAVTPVTGSGLPAPTLIRPPVAPLPTSTPQPSVAETAVGSSPHPSAAAAISALNKGPRPSPGPVLGIDGQPFIGPEPLKPDLTYATIIYRALANIPRGRGTLGQVCDWVASEWEWFRLNPDAGWQNSIRHNLSLNKAFLKVPRIETDDPESKGSVWILDPVHAPEFAEKERKAQELKEAKAKRDSERVGLPERPTPPPVPVKPANAQAKPKKPLTPVTEKPPHLAASINGTPPGSVVRPGVSVSGVVRPPQGAPSVIPSSSVRPVSQAPSTVPETTPRPAMPATGAIRPNASGIAPVGQPRPVLAGTAVRPGARPPVMGANVRPGVPLAGARPTPRPLTGQPAVRPAPGATPAGVRPAVRPNPPGGPVARPLANGQAVRPGAIARPPGTARPPPVTGSTVARPTPAGARPPPTARPPGVVRPVAGVPGARPPAVQRPPPVAGAKPAAAGTAIRPPGPRPAPAVPPKPAAMTGARPPAVTTAVKPQTTGAIRPPAAKPVAGGSLGSLNIPANKQFPIVVKPIPPHLRNSNLNTHSHILDGPPLVVDEGTIILNPSIFSHLTPEQLKHLQSLGAQQTLQILQAYIVQHLREKIRQQGANGVKGAAAAASTPGAASTTKSGTQTAKAAAPNAVATGTTPSTPKAAPAPPVAAKAVPVKPAVVAPKAATKAPPAKPPLPANVVNNPAIAALLSSAQQLAAKSGSTPASRAGSPAAQPPAETVRVIAQLAATAGDPKSASTPLTPNAVALLQYLRQVGAGANMTTAAHILATGVIPAGAIPAKAGTPKATTPRPAAAKPVAPPLAHKPASTPGPSGAPPIATPGPSTTTLTPQALLAALNGVSRPSPPIVSPRPAPPNPVTPSTPKASALPTAPTQGQTPPPSVLGKRPLDSKPASPINDPKRQKV